MDTAGKMMRQRKRPTQSSFASVLVAAVEMGGLQFHQVYTLCFKCGLSSDCCVGNALLKGFVELGGVDDLRKVMEGMCGLDEISIEILLKGYTKHSALDDAFELFRSSCQILVGFSPFAFACLISLCTNLGQIECGTHVHGYAVKVGFDIHASVVNSLITFYSRSHCLEDAEILFNYCRSRGIVTWNLLISGFAYNNEGNAGFGLILKLLASGIGMNQSTFLSFLSCCASVAILESAKRAHVLILKLREHKDQGIDNTILTMYCRCGSLEYAEIVFESMEVQDIVSFYLIMSLYRKCGRYEEPLSLFLRARSERLQVDEVILSGAVCSCSKLGFLDTGQQIHGCIIKTGFERKPHLRNSLLEMYSQCGSFHDMERSFQHIEEPDLFSWNIILMGYTHYGLICKSIVVVKEMESLGFALNEFSYSALLDSCNCCNNPLIGEQINCRIQKAGLVFDTVLMNYLLTIYSNCQMVEKAMAAFKEICSPDTTSWNAMVSGYAQNVFAEESVRVYTTMKKYGIKTNHMTFASVSMSCAMLAELKLGSQIHGQVIEGAFDLNLSVSNSLITMDAKCGDMHGSSQIFERIVHRDVITWNSMVCAYVDHGYGREAIGLLIQMISSGLKPDDVSFVGILSACSRAGLILEASYMFNYMLSQHDIVLTEEHYTCMVDILCRSGNVEEAKDLIESTPIIHCPMVWKTLLSACKLIGNVRLGEVVAEKIMQLEPQDSAAYVLLSDVKCQESTNVQKQDYSLCSLQWSLCLQVS